MWISVGVAPAQLRSQRCQGALLLEPVAFGRPAATDCARAQAAETLPLGFGPAKEP